MSAINLYATTLLVYFGVDVLAAWGLNLQYGLYGMYNFAFILFQSVGAYTAAVLALGRPSHQFGAQQYFFGASLPFPLPIIIAGIIASVFGFAVALILRQGMRGDYEALVTFVIAVMALLTVSAVIPLFNGEAGLSLVPQPLAGTLRLSAAAYAWIYVAFVAIVCLISYVVIRRVMASPLGRAVRAVRESANGAAALGVNATWCRIVVSVLGAAMAGVSGALLVEFIGTWSPGSWSYGETLVIFSAIIVGGVGNNLGVLIGVFATQIVFAEGSRYLPASLPPNLVGSLQWIVIGVMTLAFLWLRPQGIVPERRYCVPGEPARDREIAAEKTGHAAVTGPSRLTAGDGEL
jgi:branched-chain amino acid transport system permease protein